MISEVENYDESILNAEFRLLNDEHLDFSHFLPSPQTSVTEHFKRGWGIKGLPRREAEFQN